MKHSDRYINIAPKFLLEAHKAGHLDSYAYWLYFKHLFRNGCIYNYNILRLAHKSGLSRTTVRKYINLFIALGWCRMHHGNLIFCSYQQLLNRDYVTKAKMLILKPHVKQYQTALYAWMVSNRQKQCLHAATTRHRDQHLLGTFPDAIDTRYSFSVKTAARLFHCPRRTANNILLKLQAEGWIFRQRMRRLMCDKVTPQQYEALRPDIPYTHIYSKGRIFRIDPSSLVWKRIIRPDVQAPNSIALPMYSNFIRAFKRAFTRKKPKETPRKVRTQKPRKQAPDSAYTKNRHLYNTVTGHRYANAPLVAPKVSIKKAAVCILCRLFTEGMNLVSITNHLLQQPSKISPF